MKEIYLDNAATTAILPEVLDAMMPFLKESYGNASSHYQQGTRSKRAIDDSREIIASMIGCSPHEIYFTSGGSEANSWAIKGLKNPYTRHHMHAISDTQEHHSVLFSLASRRQYHQDLDYSLAGADVNGLINAYEIEGLFRLNTRLCTIQAVNNETGIIQPVQQIALRCKDKGAIFHCDAVQAFGHLQLPVRALCIDMMSASAHKLHGPKGVGFLYIADDIRGQMHPLINGGQQEHGLRGSTENVAGIVGFGKAAEIAAANMAANFEYIRSLSTDLVNMLSRLPGVHTNVNLRHTDYRHISIRIDGVRAEEMLSLLDSVNICVSSGSACNSDSKQPSHVLKAIGLTDEEAGSTIRVSLCELNTRKELQEFVTYLGQFIDILRGRDNG